jgi:hypothetical protein
MSLSDRFPTVLLRRAVGPEGQAGPAVKGEVMDKMEPLACKAGQAAPEKVAKTGVRADRFFWS